MAYIGRYALKVNPKECGLFPRFFGFAFEVSANLQMRRKLIEAHRSAYKAHRNL